MKHLLLDIETSPNVAHVWSLWNANVSLVQLRESSYMMSWAAKWYGDRKVDFASIHHDGRDDMLARIHELMSDADVITHYNGLKFDIPNLNKEFVTAGMHPPAPSKHIDLYQVVRKRFRFPSNKLEYVAGALGLEGKVKHAGHQLWVRCLAGDDKAWAEMRRYNKRDVTLLEQVYDKLLPWIENHPHRAFFDPDAGCPSCGASAIYGVRQGFAYLVSGIYQRFQCKAPRPQSTGGVCGSWYRGKRAIDSVETRSVKL